MATACPTFTTGGPTPPTATDTREAGPDSLHQGCGIARWAVSWTEAYAADQRQLDRRREGIDAEREAQEVDFDALDGARENARNSVEGNLKAAAAGRRGE